MNQGNKHLRRLLGHRYWRMIVGIIGILGWVLAVSNPCFAYEQFNRLKTYDRHFSKYAKRFFGPGFDWRFFKSQAIAESQLNPSARSPVGAVGLMQIMPRTFREIRSKSRLIKGSAQQPKWNIAAGIWYDRSLWNVFTEHRPFIHRVNFMFGAYNAGKGSIIKAQKKAKQQGLNPNLWDSIVQVLKEVTGKRSRETIGYVKKIHRIKKVLR